MGTTNGPDSLRSAAAEPSWSIRTAVAFFVLWAALMVIIQSVSIGLVAIFLHPRPVSMAEFQEKLLAWPGLPLLSVACVLATWGITFELVFRSLHGFPRAAVVRALGLKAPAPVWSVIAAVPLGVLVCLLAEVVADLLHAGDQTTGFDQMMATPGGRVALSLLALALAPSAEEVFFRGFLYPPFERLARQWGLANLPARGVAALANAAVFALSHVFVYSANVGYLLAVLLLGLTAASLRAWTGSVWPGMIAHFFFNGSSLLLYFLQP